MAIQLNFKAKKDIQYEIPSEGNCTVKIVGLIKPFETENMNGDKYMATRYIFETQEQTKDGEHFLTLLSKNMRLDSFHVKSNLYALACAAFRRKDLTEVDVPTAETLVGKFVDVIIDHTVSNSNGKTYANAKMVYATKNIPTDWESTFVSKEDKAVAPTKEQSEEEDMSDEQANAEFDKILLSPKPSKSSKSIK